MPARVPSTNGWPRSDARCAASWRWPPPGSPTLCRDASDVDGEIDALNWLLAIEPLQEGAHRELMASFARTGRYTEALRQYQLCRTILRRELDLAPDPATESLYRELMKKRRAGAGGPLYALPGAEPEDELMTALAAEHAEPASVDDRVMQPGVVLAMRLPDLGRQRRALDPEETREFTQRLQRLFDETVALHGGRADRLSGETLHAVFGLENLTGNEAQRALGAAQALQQAFTATELVPGSPAIGIAQGSLLPTRINGPFPLAGNPVGDADALAGRAAPHEILLADDLRRAIGTRPVLFAGRHAELALMTSLLERCVASRRGRTIVTRGEAGIGKTRLLEALAGIARSQGVAAHRVQVLDFGQVKARRPLAALFASLLGVGPDASPAERGQAVSAAIAAGRLPAESILHASGLIGAPLSADQASIERNLDAQAIEHGRMEIVRQLIESACSQAPLLLVIEDLHYAGGEEAARLGELAAAVVAQPALLVLSTRPDEDPIDPAWRARARGCPLTTLDLAPLTDEESRELAANYPELPAETVDTCIRRAQGHPLFLDQLLRAAEAGETAMPASVQALVLSRVERLEREDRQALHAASVLGLRFPREALAAMLGRRRPPAGPAGRRRAARRRGQRSRVRARADARGGVRLAAEIAAARAARAGGRLVRRPRSGAACRAPRGGRRPGCGARLHRRGGRGGGIVAARSRDRVRRARGHAGARAARPLPCALVARRAADAHRAHARRDRDAARGHRPAARCADGSARAAGAGECAADSRPV